MFSKLKFNNLLISNKKIIQQGRLHVIKKLIQAIKKSQYVQEKYPENIKNKTRIRKQLACLEHLKKLKRVQIIKNVLLLEKSPTAIITNSSSEPQEMVTALLATNKVISDFIKKLRIDLNLHNQDVTWKEKMLETSKRICKIQKTDMKRRKRREMKEQKVIDRKRKEWLAEHNSQGTKNSNSSTPGILSTTGTWLEEDILLNNTNSEVVQAKTEDVLETTKITVQSEELITEKPARNKKIAQKIKKSNVNGNLTKPINKHAEKRQLNLNNNETDLVKVDDDTSIEKAVKNTTNGNVRTNAMKHNVQKTIVKNLVEQEPIENNKQTHVVDPFFVTETGDNYLSTAIVNYNQEEHDVHELYSKPMSKASVRKDFAMRKQQSNVSKTFNNTYNTNNSILNLKSSNKRKAVTTDNINEKVHPSWAAKQKLKPIITNFQGKKITFDDNIEEKHIKSKVNNTQNTTNNITKIESVQSDVHPSWAAKQKMKPTIATFVGKKVVFDDNE